jgi:hypothetical protein
VQASAGRHRTRRRVAVEGLQRDDQGRDMINTKFSTVLT